MNGVKTNMEREIIPLKKLSKNELKNLLSELKQIIINIYGESLKKIILYGSYARRDYRSESDIDVMILASGSKFELKTFFEKAVIATNELDIKYGIFVSIIDVNIKDFDEYINYVPFYANVYKEGTKIYG